MARILWTRERDAYVARRLAEGASYTTIAGELRISRGAIAGRRQRLSEQQDKIEPAGQDRVEAEPDPRLSTEGCRWIVGDPKGTWHFCGKSIAAGERSWCAEHAFLVKPATRGKSSEGSNQT